MSRELSRAQLLSEINQNSQAFLTSSFLFKSRMAEQLGLYPTDFQCINILDLEGPLPAGKLAEKLSLSTGATTTAISRLEQAGYVKRVADKNDKRKVIIHLAGSGIESMRQLFKPIEKAVETVWDDFSDTELQVVATYFSKMLHLR